MLIRIPWSYHIPIKIQDFIANMNHEIPILVALGGGSSKGLLFQSSKKLGSIAYNLLVHRDFS